MHRQIGLVSLHTQPACAIVGLSHSPQASHSTSDNINGLKSGKSSMLRAFKLQVCYSPGTLASVK